MLREQRRIGFIPKGISAVIIGGTWGRVIFSCQNHAVFIWAERCTSVTRMVARQLLVSMGIALGRTGTKMSSGHGWKPGVSNVSRQSLLRCKDRHGEARRTSSAGRDLISILLSFINMI